jgi:alkylmercury lyase
VVNMPVEQLEAIFEQFAARGGEFDEEGNLVGASLTLNPTPHHFRVKGNDLYAWCSLDTLFLPGLIGETAVIISTDPVSGEPIHLTITPHKVKEYCPSSTVLSISVPGISCRTETSTGPATGPQSETCSQMYFFTSRETAETWLKDSPGIAIFTVEEAWQLAKAHWLDRRKNN